MTFRDQDSRSRLEVQVRGETETRLSKMCLETVSRTETGLENYITSDDLTWWYFDFVRINKKKIAGMHSIMGVCVTYLHLLFLDAYNTAIWFSNENQKLCSGSSTI